MRLLTIPLALLLCVLTVSVALAHAALTGSVPAEGEVVAAAPHRFVLKFNEPVSPLVLRLIMPDGASAELSGAQWRGDGLEIPCPLMLGHGGHLLSWRVVSQDGHPIGGSLGFSVGERGEAGAAAAAAAPGLAAATCVLRALFYVALFCGIGGVAFGLCFAGGTELPAASRAVIGCALAAVFPIAALSLGVLGLDALALPWSGLLTAQAWQAAVASTYAMTLLLACIAAALGLAARHMRRAPLAILAVLAAAAAFAVSGHAASAAPQWLSRPAVFIHVLCLLLWLGALLPLALLYACQHRERLGVLQRFSRRIGWPIVGLLASGILLSAVQLQPRFDPTDSAYGRILLVKLGLVALLLLLAAVNRYRLTPRIERGDAAAGRLLAKSIAVEAVLALAILSLVALWRYTPPPRALAAEEQMIVLHLHSTEAMAELRLTPGARGRNSVEIVLTHHDGAPFAMKEVRLSAAQPAVGIEPIRRQAVATRDGRWTVPELDLQVAGQWTIRIDALIDDFRGTRFEGVIEIRS